MLLPMFPLNTVFFPGVATSLHVFEDRYRALVHHLLRSDSADRLLGSVGIREGYEVGDHGAQSLFRIGCRLHMTEIDSHADGTFEVTVVARDRIRLDQLVTSGPFPQGEVVVLDDEPAADLNTDTVSVRSLFTAYRSQVAPWRGDPHPGQLPKDPGYLSWTLASIVPMPMPMRQELLADNDVTSRLQRIEDVLRGELRAMNVIPSLPATEVARTRWSPN